MWSLQRLVIQETVVFPCPRDPDALEHDSLFCSSVNRRPALLEPPVSLSFSLFQSLSPSLIFSFKVAKKEKKGKM